MCVTNRHMKTLHNSLALKLTTNVLFRRFIQWKCVYANIIITTNWRCWSQRCVTVGRSMSFFLKNGKKTFWLKFVCVRWNVLLFVCLHVKDLHWCCHQRITFVIFKTYESHDTQVGFLDFIYWLFLFSEFGSIHKQDLCLAWSATVYRRVPRMHHNNKKRTNSKHILFIYHIRKTFVSQKFEHRNKEYCFWFCYVFTFVYFFFLNSNLSAGFMCIYLSNFFYLFVSMCIILMYCEHANRQNNIKQTNNWVRNKLQK